MASKARKALGQRSLFKENEVILSCEIQAIKNIFQFRMHARNYLLLKKHGFENNLQDVHCLH